MDELWCRRPLCDWRDDDEHHGAAEAEIVDAILANCEGLRQAGHNVLLPTLAIKAMRDLPAARTRGRVDGIRKLVACFTVDDVPVDDGDVAFDLVPQAGLCRFVMEEFAASGERFDGRGQGWTGHLLTYARALCDLVDLDLRHVAEACRGGFEIYVRRIRRGPQPSDAPKREKTRDRPLPDQDRYWLRRSGDWTLGHALKYPYAFFGLRAKLDDPKARPRAAARAWRVL